MRDSFGVFLTVFAIVFGAWLVYQYIDSVNQRFAAIERRWLEVPPIRVVGPLIIDADGARACIETPEGLRNTTIKNIYCNSGREGPAPTLLEVPTGEGTVMKDLELHGISSSAIVGVRPEWSDIRGWGYRREGDQWIPVMPAREENPQ